MREDKRACVALPINTYGGHGVAKKNVTKSNHAIIYTGRDAPAPTPEEEATRGEMGLLPHAIRVEADSRTKKLDPMSRVDFAQPRTINHHWKVKSFGKVNQKSMHHLTIQWRDVTSRNVDASGSNGLTPSQRRWLDEYRSLVKGGFTDEEARSYLKSWDSTGKNERRDATRDETKYQAPETGSGKNALDDG